MLMCYETPLNAENGHDFFNHIEVVRPENVVSRNNFKEGFPPLDYSKLNGVFNLTMGYRLDSDIVTRHGITWKRAEKLTTRVKIKIKLFELCEEKSNSYFTRNLRLSTRHFIAKMTFQPTIRRLIKKTQSQIGQLQSSGFGNMSLVCLQVFSFFQRFAHSSLYDSSIER